MKIWHSVRGADTVNLKAARRLPGNPDDLTPRLVDREIRFTVMKEQGEHKKVFPFGNRLPTTGAEQ
jgi:hypothetical protein